MGCFFSELVYDAYLPMRDEAGLTFELVFTTGRKIVLSTLSFDVIEPIPVNIGQSVCLVYCEEHVSYAVERKNRIEGR